MTTRLQAARRTRGWSQASLIAKLQARASAKGFQLPAVASMKSLLSRWENGHVTPSDLYVGLLQDVFGLTADELGLSRRRDAEPADPLAWADTADELVVGLGQARCLDPDMVGLLQRQTDGLRLLDRPLGAPRLLGQIRLHMEGLEALLHHGFRPTQRRPVARVLADTAALAGWQALDVGAVAESWKHFEVAKAAAREADDAALLAYATGEQAYVLLDVGQPADALDLAMDAKENAGSAIPPLMRVWLHAAESEFRAAAGEGPASLRSIDAGERLLDSPSDDLPYLSLGRVHLERWRGNVLARVGHRDAVPCLSRARASMDPQFKRATAGLHCDLAAALATEKEMGEAMRHATEAQRLAQEIGSVRQARRVSQLRSVA